MLRSDTPPLDPPMALPRRLGPYELTRLLGRGGMGEVYRARDTRLNRTVAIKLLPRELSDSPSARQRFEREARAIASLHHPKVCVVHDVGHEDGLPYIVMEYLEGESLAARLRRGPLPFDELLQRAIEIAEGLQHAHSVGIVHRDVKPANIILTSSETKIVDFGLAALRHSIVTDDTVERSTITRPGLIMGTLQYMAPEQLEVLDGPAKCDPRTDVFACGLVLYEMATGKHAFGGPSSAAIISAILTQPPPSIRAVGRTYSPDLDWAIRRCLAKDPADRWQTAADLAAVLRWLQVKSGTVLDAQVDDAAPHRRRGRMPVAVAAGALALVLGTWAVASRWSAPAPSGDLVPLRTTIPIISGASLPENGTPVLAFSKDGRRLAYTAVMNGTRGLFLRWLDRLEATLLPGTQGAESPFFSPDGNAVGFFADGKLKRMALDGSSPVVLCDAPRGRGGSWVDPDTIVFAPSSDTTLYRVAARGGEPEQITTLSRQPLERSHRWPEVLPGGRAVVFTTGNPTDYLFSDAQIVVQSFEGARERRVLIEAGAFPRYTNGYLLFYRAQSVVAVPFDSERLQVTGSAVTVVEDASKSRYLAVAQYAASARGSLVYLPAGGEAAQLTWISRNGTSTPIENVSGPFGALRLSPDGKRVAFHLDDGQGDVGVYDFATGLLSRITHRPEFEGTPVWRPDGTHVVFASDRGPGVQMFWKRWDDPRGAPGALAQAPAPDQALAPGEHARIPHAWSPDGRFLAFTENHPDTRRDIWIAPYGPGAGKPYPLVVSPFEDSQAVFSPDGKWLAYLSNDAGADVIYVQPFPDGGTRVRVTPPDSYSPRWAQNGELFYWKGGRVFAVTLSTAGSTLKVGPTRSLFEMPTRLSFDVSPDGQRVIVPQPKASTPSTGFVLVHGWPAAVSR